MKIRDFVANINDEQIRIGAARKFIAAGVALNFVQDVAIDGSRWFSSGNQYESRNPERRKPEQGDRAFRSCFVFSSVVLSWFQRCADFITPLLEPSAAQSL
jgi:hypothetical protein